MITDVIGSIIGGVFSGGATGLIGIALSMIGEAKKRQTDLELAKLQHAQTLELRRLDIEQQARMAEMSAASAERLAEINAEARASESASADYQASLKADKATYVSEGALRISKADGGFTRFVKGSVLGGLGLVDVLRGLIRPAATIYSMILLTLLFIWVRDIYARSAVVMTQEQAHKLTMDVVDTITYLATTVCVWWFGVRGQQKK